VTVSVTMKLPPAVGVAEAESVLAPLSDETMPPPLTSVQL
jgi:hypothetical protein